MQHTKLFSAIAVVVIASCAGDRVNDEATLIEQPSVAEISINALPGDDYDAAQTQQIKQDRQFAAVSRREIIAKQSARYSAVSMQSMDMAMPWPTHRQNSENYVAFDENRVLQVGESPVSTFSIDVDTAAYSNVRRMLLREGRLPPGDAVKVEEFINYFDYSYQSPDLSDAPFSVHTEIAPTPWNAKTHLLKIGLKGFQPAMDKRPPANLVFLVDVSGSMRSPMKLGLVKKSLRLMVNQMQADDRVAIAVYAGAAGLILDSTPGTKKATIFAAIDTLEAGGSTNGGAGIRLAYNVASQYFVDGGINRVLIASDGDMNVGTVNHEALKELIENNRERGIALTTLGYGSGNYNYALMEEMADVGNGNAAYIDTLKEAHKVLVKEMGSTLQTIAKDVKIQIEFNPAFVSEYRLIGYENRILEREDFRNDKIDAGEIGVGHTVTALYEIALTGSGGEQVAPLRYQTPAQPEQEAFGPDNSVELGYMRLRYKAPGGDVSREIKQVIRQSDSAATLADSSADFRFAASVAGFGQLLRGGKYTGQWSYDDLLNLARGARGDDRHGYRGEMLALVELSRDLSGIGNSIDES
ncbi:MAG: Ca-activated chloride channel family protein [Halieaceae bacterium]|jgi:Ca-activated chloride channel family protein